MRRLETGVAITSLPGLATTGLLIAGLVGAGQAVALDVGADGTAGGERRGARPGRDRSRALADRAQRHPVRWGPPGAWQRSPQLGRRREFAVHQVAPGNDGRIG